MWFFVKWSYLVDPQATYSQILITETYEKNLQGQFSKLTGITLYTYGLGLISESSEKSGYLVYHFDQLGSTKRITDKDGKTVYTMNYGSYGELFGIKDAKGNLVNFKDNPIAFLYNGQYGIVTDQNTLTYMRARYYNPEIKRFLNQDVLTGSIGNSQSLNRYSYVQGNPIRFTDPFGLCPDGSGTEGFFEGLANDLKSAFNSAMMSIGKAIYDHLPGQARQAVDFAVAKTVSFMQKHADEILSIYKKLRVYRECQNIAKEIIKMYVSTKLSRLEQKLQFNLNKKNKLMVFDSMDEAAYYFVQINNPLTHEDNRERGTYIYEVEMGGARRYMFLEAKPGGHSNVLYNVIAKYGMGLIAETSASGVDLGTVKPCAFVHTHPSCICHIGEDFSDVDIKLTNIPNIDAVYLGTPKGILYKYTQSDGKKQEVYSDLPKATNTFQNSKIK